MPAADKGARDTRKRKPSAPAKPPALGALPPGKPLAKAPPKVVKPKPAPPGLGALPGKATKNLPAPARKLAREVYKAAPVEARRELVTSPKAAAPIVKLHRERQRAAQDVAAAKVTQDLKPLRAKPTTQVKGDAEHGRRIQRKQMVSALGKVKGELPIKGQVKQAGPGDVLGKVVDLGKRYVSNTLVHGANPAGGVAATVADKAGIKDPKLRKLSDDQVKRNVDALGFGLKQLGRTSSTTAGWTNALTAGKNPLKGAVRGFIKNDQSFETTAKRAGLHGTAANVVGLGADIALDPLTYLSLGSSAPATAGAKAARAATAAKYGSRIERAVRAGDHASADALKREAAAELRGKLAKAAKLEKDVRGVQVGIRTPRLPGKPARTRATKGRVTAAVSKATGASHGARRVTRGELGHNVLGTVYPAAVPKGSTKAAHDALRGVERESHAIEDTYKRRFTQLAITLRRKAKTPEAYRAIIDAQESGRVADLPDDLRGLAERWQHESKSVADDYEKITGKPLKVSERMLAPRDLEDATGEARTILERHARGADKKAQLAREDVAAARASSEGLSGNLGQSAAARERGASAAGGGRGLDVALEELGRHQTVAESARNVAEHLAARKAPQTAAEEADFVRVLRHATEGLEGRKDSAKLNAVLDRLARRADERAPENYVKHVSDETLDATFGAKNTRPKGTAGRSQARAGYEQARIDRRPIADQPEGRTSYDAPRVAAYQGIESSRSLGNKAFFKAVRDELSTPGSADNWKTHADHEVVHVDKDGRVQLLDDDAAEKGLIDVQEGRADASEYRLVPRPVADAIEHRTVKSPKGAVARNYDAALRAFKTVNTVARPGFFGTQAVGNAYTLWLTDTGGFFKSLGVLRGLRGARAEATGRAGSLTSKRTVAVVNRLVPDSFVVDGEKLTMAQVMDRAERAGAIHVGSRAASPVELTDSQLAGQRIAEGVSGKAKRSLDAMGNLAEDQDDAAKLVMWVHAKTKLGMSDRDATFFVYEGMPNYNELSDFEKRVLKRIIPFYVYTSRNLPIQVKRLMARPGKPANADKVRQALAQEAGLPPDWQQGLDETDQERTPIPLPGVKFGGGTAAALGKLAGVAGGDGNQAYLYPRAPGEDIGRVLQLLEGGKGISRVAQRSGADLAPFIKAPLELKFNRRFDFDRPIYGDEAGRSPEAGSLLRALGATQSFKETDPRSGKKYEAASPVVDYLVRTLGGSPGSALLNTGKKLPNRSGTPVVANTNLQSALSYLGGVGLNAPNQLDTVQNRLIVEQRKAEGAAKKARRRYGNHTKQSVEAADKVSDIKDTLAFVRAALGYQGAEDQKTKTELRRIRPKLPAELRALKQRLGDIGP